MSDFLARKLCLQPINLGFQRRVILFSMTIFQLSDLLGNSASHTVMNAAEISPKTLLLPFAARSKLFTSLEMFPKAGNSPFPADSRKRARRALV